MTPEPQPAQSDPASDPTSHADLRLQVARELVQISLAVTRALAEKAIRQAQSDAPPVPDAPDPTLALTRIARTVRQCLALESRLEREAQTPAPTTQPTPHSDPTRVRRRIALIRRKVEREIETFSRDTENLLADLDEKLEDPAFIATIFSRPVIALVCRLCDDIGLFGSGHMTDAELAERIAEDDAEQEAAANAPEPAPSHPPPPD